MNKVDEIIDNVMECITNGMFLMIVLFGVPYFFYVIAQFLSR